MARSYWSKQSGSRFALVETKFADTELTSNWIGRPQITPNCQSNCYRPPLYILMRSVAYSSNFRGMIRPSPVPSALGKSGWFRAPLKSRTSDGEKMPCLLTGERVKRHEGYAIDRSLFKLSGFPI